MVGLVGGGGWRVGDDAAGGGGGGAVAAGAAAAAEAEHMRRLHSHAPGEHQCSSALVKHIKAPVHLVSSTTHDAFHPLFFFCSSFGVCSIGCVWFGYLARWLLLGSEFFLYFVLALGLVLVRLGLMRSCCLRYLFG